MSLSFLSSASSSGLFCKNKAACQTQKSLQFYLYELMNGTFYPLSNHHQFTTLLYSKAGQRLLHLLQWFPYSQNNITLQFQWSRYSCIQQYNVTVAMAQINDDFISNTASFCWVKIMIITVVYTQNTGGHLQLSKHNAWRVYTVLPLNMTFWMVLALLWLLSALHTNPLTVVHVHPVLLKWCCVWLCLRQEDRFNTQND